MKLEDLLRMAFNDGKRYGQGNTNLNFKQHFESTEYFEAIKLVKNCSIPDVVLQSEQLCDNPHCDDGIVDADMYGHPIYCQVCDKHN